MESTVVQKEELKQKFEEWCDKFKSSKKELMSEDLASLFMNLLIMESQNKKIDDIPPELKFSYDVTKSRAEFIGLEINQLVIFLICFISNGIPGRIVMYLYFLRYNQIKNKTGQITVSQLAYIFPMGFVTEDEINMLWDEQKWNGINMLDIIDIKSMKE